MSRMDVLVLERPLSQWAVAMVAGLAVALAMSVLHSWLAKHLVLSQPTGSVRSLLARLSARWLRLTTAAVAVSAAVMLLNPSQHVLSLVRGLLVVVAAIQASFLLPTVVDWLLHRLFVRTTGPDPAVAAPPSNAESTSVASTLTGLRWLILLVAYSVLMLLALQNLGVNVTAVVASLGVGGIAVALAVQNILGDLFASLTITLDRPFLRGDFIVVGNEMGVVEHVGLKTTRVRSLSGEELVFGNADLLQSRIRNYKRMAERRVVFQVSVPHTTGTEDLVAIPGMIQAAVASRPELRFDRSHLAAFGESALQFETVYIIGSADYNKHMDALQAVHLAILRDFRARGIALAIPAQTIHVAPAEESPDGKASRGVGA
ncbi:MAG: mechanosensitive ion channel [Phycisphaerae bacterium]|nr:mechanosensitive ion channel [Phycisphaerae bacterium]